MTGYRPSAGRSIAGAAIRRMLLIFIALFALVAEISAASIHHRLEVTVHGERGEIEVVDRVVLEGSAVFSLAATLEVQAAGGRLEAVGSVMPGVTDYRIVPDGADPVVLSYRGPMGTGKTDIFDMPRAVVDAQGVFLDAASAWYPLFRTAAVTFELTARLPQGWALVGQGRTTVRPDGRQVVVADFPQEDIYLLAGPYTAYSRERHGRTLAAYLLQPDAALADRYLDHIGGYLDFYEALIGPYPYDQFAVVENRWQTGYGMPGFTLLGSRVMRLPFLLTSSLPHEILHNWFGNGVYIDPSEGNWSEGLTAYLADYLIKEADGKGVEHRQRLLARYTDFAADGRDVPVAEFRSRHDDASQAVGYDKVQMLLHMVRRQVGDATFIDSIRRFYADWRFERATFKDLLQFFRTEDWAPGPFYAQWIARAGAPVLALEQASVSETDGGYTLHLGVGQKQGGVPYAVELPVYVMVAGEVQARRVAVSLEGRQRRFALTFDKRPLRVDLDPAFEVFRTLSPLERPSALGRLFGASRQWLVIPRDASPELQAAWHELAQAWGRRYGNVSVIGDDEMGRVPAGDALWLLGWGNRGLAALGSRLEGQGQHRIDDGVEIAGQAYSRDDYAAVLLDPDNARPALGFIGAEDVTAIRRLAGKLTHYGSFGRMVFELPGLNNLRRDRLAVSHSPLSRQLGEQASALRLAPEQQLAERIAVGLPGAR